MTKTDRMLLDEAGYVALPGFVPPGLVGELRQRTEELFESEGENAGSEFRQEPNTRRLANLVAKDKLYQQVVAWPEILEYVAAVLGPDYKLSSLNARSANPNSDSLQPLHADMGLVADVRGYSVCNTVWMLDDFTVQNGTLRAVPGSHRWRKLPQEQMNNPNDRHPLEVLVTGEAGTVVVMNAHLWHGGTANRTGAHRRALHAFYCRNDKPQQQYQKRLIPAELQETFPADLRRVLALDDFENDRLSAGADRPSGFLK